MICGGCLNSMNIRDNYTKEEWDRRAKERDKICDNLVGKVIKARGSFYGNEQDIPAFENELLGFKDGVADVLEWGSGYSTKHFSDFLNELNAVFTWEAIEYDIRWYLAVLKLDLDQRVRVHLFDEEILRIDDRRALRNFPMNEYISFPRKLGKKYDVILVDGTKRIECLKEIPKIIKENGVVLVHDAQRPEYHKEMEEFDGEYLTETLWKGKIKK